MVLSTAQAVNIQGISVVLAGQRLPARTGRDDEPAMSKGQDASFSNDALLPLFLRPQLGSIVFSVWLVGRDDLRLHIGRDLLITTLLKGEGACSRSE